MAVDPKANQAYRDSKDIKFAPGQQVWVSGIEFRVIDVKDGQLILEPVAVKL